MTTGSASEAGYLTDGLCTDALNASHSGPEWQPNTTMARQDNSECTHNMETKYRHVR